jgi:putative protease
MLRNQLELLAPAGNFEKLKTAIYFGADAVYLGGKAFSLRAMADNFTNDEILQAVEYAHKRNVKIYVTANIFARNYDLEKAAEYFKFLQSAGVDAVLITDSGLIRLCKEVAPNLNIHLSTQANTLNKYTVKYWGEMGVERVVVARELSLAEIKEMHDFCPEVQIEAFIHGAMCISYSGRCLLSNYFNGRDANRGECVQACRWHYEIREKTKEGDFYPIEEDDRGTYILNSKDLCLVNHIKELVEAGITSLKVEGRMKSTYYVASVINTYRRAIDNYYNNKESDFDYIEELQKTSSRSFTTGFYFSEGDTINLETSKAIQTYDFVAVVLEDTKDGYAYVEHRNKFIKGDELEILSTTDTFNKTIILDEILNENKEPLEEVKIVKERVYIKTDMPLKKGDILRKKIVL